MDRRKFMLGVGAVLAAPRTAPAEALALPPAASYHGVPIWRVCTHVPAAVWRRLNYGTPDAPSYFMGVEVEW